MAGQEQGKRMASRKGAVCLRESDTKQRGKGQCIKALYYLQSV